MDVHGFCDERFSSLSDQLHANVSSGADVGASVAVTVDGEMLVDIWAGHADADALEPWRADTVGCVFSVSKTMVALVVLMLADRGELALDDPVSRYWPEFGAESKDAVRIEHVLAHTSGLPTWRAPLDFADLYDWDRVTSLLAEQELFWEPGTRIGYQMLTQGYLLGEVVRRITGTDIGTFFAAEVAGPARADFQFGLPADRDHLVAFPVTARTYVTRDVLGDDPIAAATAGNPPLTPGCCWDSGWRRALVPAVNGYGNARSIATIHGALACGGAVGDRQLLSEAGARSALSERAVGVDVVAGRKVRYGAGFALDSDNRSAWWSGWGGSFVGVDPARRMVVAYVMNKFGSGFSDPRGFDFFGAARHAGAVIAG